MFCRFCRQEYSQDDRHWMSNGKSSAICRLRAAERKRKWESQSGHTRSSAGTEEYRIYRNRKNREERKRRKEQPMFGIMQNLRRRLRRYLKGERKPVGLLTIIGCSIEQLKEQLEAQFYMRHDGVQMSWSNYGRLWHVDHKHPLSRFNLFDEGDLAKSSHYSNLAPMWAEQNIRKSNKLGGVS